MKDDDYGQAFDKAKAEQAADAKARREAEEEYKSKTRDEKAKAVRIMKEVVSAELDKAGASLKSRGAFIETQYGGNSVGTMDFLQVKFRIRDEAQFGRSSDDYQITLGSGISVDRLSPPDGRSPLRKGHSIRESHGIHSLDDLTTENMKKLILAIISDDYQKARSEHLNPMK